MYYGDLQVTILNETKTPDWVITEFKIAEVSTENNLMKQNALLATSRIVLGLFMIFF